jgi:multicomponent Na+:H+ antiporter subunit B
MMVFLYLMQFNLLILSVYIAFAVKNFNVAIGSSMFSIICVVLYVIMNATDLATTEVTLGLSLSTVLYMMAILYIKRVRKKGIKKVTSTPDQLQSIKKSEGVFNILIVFAITALYIALFRAIESIPNEPLDSAKLFYIENTKKDYHFNSIVTAIVAGYRAFDTLFESVVIFIGGMGMYTVLMGDRKEINGND